MNMNKVIIKDLLLKLLLVFCLLSSYPDAVFSSGWIKSYGGHPSSAKKTSDGGYIIVGTVEDHSGYRILKLDKDGNAEWQKVYGEEDYQTFLPSIQQTSDGGYLAAGDVSYPSNSAGERAVRIVKMDHEGNVQWQKTYHGTGYGYLIGNQSAQETSDGKYIIVARKINSSGTLLNGSCMFKLDREGNIIWQKTYEDAGYGGLDCILQASDGGLISVGTLEREGQSSIRILL
jgi:hypothetical protein